MNDTLNVVGTVHVLLEKHNVVIHSETIHNLVVSRGREIFAERMFYCGDTLYNAPKINSIKVGNDDTAAVLSQTELIGGLTAEKEVYSSSVSSNVLNYSTTFLDVATDTIADDVKEIGLFSDTGEMMCRTVLTTPFTKTEDELLTVYWQITIGKITHEYNNYTQWKRITTIQQRN